MALPLNAQCVVSAASLRDDDVTKHPGVTEGLLLS